MHWCLTISPSLTHTQAVQPSPATKGPTSNSPGMFSAVSHTRGRELLSQLAATTLKSIRTVSKVNRSDIIIDPEMSSVQKSLTFSTEDECRLKLTSSHNLTNPLDSNQVYGLAVESKTAQEDHRLVRTRQPLREQEFSRKDQFYVLEPELCDLLKRKGVVHCIGGRGQCPSPVPHLLDNVYFVSISDNY